jgi:predicted nucleic acid-binding protein
MIGRRKRLLLDTSILVHLLRDNETGRRIDEQFQIRRRTDRPLISIVTVGECLSLARQFGWGASRVAALEALLSELVVVPIDSRPILERFGEFHAWTRSIGRSLSNNDLWIAATVAAAGAHLVTSDRDFDALTVHIARTFMPESG